MTKTNTTTIPSLPSSSPSTRRRARSSTSGSCTIRKKNSTSRKFLVFVALAVVAVSSLLQSQKQDQEQVRVKHYFQTMTTILQASAYVHRHVATSARARSMSRNLPSRRWSVLLLQWQPEQQRQRHRHRHVTSSSTSSLHMTSSKSNTVATSSTNTSYTFSTASASANITTTATSLGSDIENDILPPQQQQQQQQEPAVVLYHPDDFLDADGKIPYPKHLSPSSAMTFRDCPQSFLIQYVYKLRQPTNMILAKGSMCHTALEHIFDLDPPDRTLDNLQNMLRAAWSTHRLKDEYRFLFEQVDEDHEDQSQMMGSSDDNDVSSNSRRDVDAEREWGQSALKLLENYYLSEDPRQIVRPNPYRREVWVNANLTVDPSVGITAPPKRQDGDSTMTDDDAPAFKVRGIVDRLDMVKGSGRKVDLKIVDYKTGKAPTLKYSNDMNRQIYQKNFFQLKIYALLMREKAAASAAQAASGTNNGGSSSVGKGMDVRYLKLYYLTSEEGRAKPWEMDLGETQQERDEVLNEVHQELAQIWTDIISLVDQQDPKAFHHCDRSFCSCHTFRPQFVPGTLWEDNTLATNSAQNPSPPPPPSSDFPTIPEIF